MNKIENPNTIQTAQPVAHAHGDPQPSSPQPPSRWMLVCVLVVAGGVLLLGGYGHWRTNADAAETQQGAIDFVPAVRTGVVKVLSDPIETTLPGQTDAFDRANVFARATGYIAERHVDIGSAVKQGDILARIASPDLGSAARSGGGSAWPGAGGAFTGERAGQPRGSQFEVGQAHVQSIGRACAERLRYDSKPRQPTSQCLDAAGQSGSCHGRGQACGSQHPGAAGDRQPAADTGIVRRRSRAVQWRGVSAQYRCGRPRQCRFGQRHRDVHGGERRYLASHPSTCRKIWLWRSATGSMRRFRCSNCRAGPSSARSLAIREHCCPRLARSPSRSTWTMPPTF